MDSQKSAVAVLRMLSGAWSYMNSRCPTELNASATPCSAYCGTSQYTDSGAVPASVVPPATAASLRWRSTKPATREAATEMVNPTPMRWRKEMPRSRPVRRRASGTSTRS
ncbi:hypothetical protein ACQJBY_063738 [Aegilops geniculata]